MKLFGHKKLLLQLESENQIKFTLVSDQLHGSILIGRDAACEWRLPATDRTASNRHAEIYVHKGRVYIRDLGSHNGIFLHGEKITGHILSPGEHYGIGDAVLHVQQAVSEQPATRGEKYHKLEQLNGKNRKKVYSLSGSNYLIGSGGESDILCPEPMVSRHHARIEIKPDGSCWIIDLGSRNGTEINHMRLSADNVEGRMLQDGDIISIVTTDFRFYDKNVVTVKSYIGTKILAAFLTLTILVSGYFIYRSIQPSAKSYIEKARLYADHQRFDEALMMLEKARLAPHSDTYSQERDELTRRVKIWKKIIKDWELVGRLLAQGNLYKAHVTLAPLLQSDIDIWNWNDKEAVELKNNAKDLLALLSPILYAENNLTDPAIPLQVIQKNLSEMKQTEKKIKNSRDPAIRQLQLRFHDIHDELSFVIKTETDIRKEIDSLTPDSSLREIFQKMEKIQIQVSNHIRDRRKSRKFVLTRNSVLCRNLLAPLKALQQTADALDRKKRQIAAFDFSKFTEAVSVPSMAACSAAPAFSNIRSELLRRNQSLVAVRNQLKAFLNALRQHGLEKPDHQLGRFRKFHEETFMQSVCACRCLNEPIVKWKYSRPQPLDPYDAFLGIESFWEYLTNLPDGVNSAFLPSQSFTPEICRLRKLYSDVVLFHEFCRSPLVASIILIDLNENRLQEWALYADEILQDRRELVRKWMTISGKSSDLRESLIYGGSALLLADDPQKDFPNGPQMLSDRLKQLRFRTDRLKNADENPETIIKNRREVLKVALPGDPAARQALSEIAEEVRK